MKKKTVIKTRDPQPDDRDPDPPPAEQTPSLSVPIPTYPEKTNDCPQCGYGVSRIYGTVEDTTRRQIRRYRVCQSTSCQFHWSTWRSMTTEEMKEAERKEYEHEG